MRLADDDEIYDVDATYLGPPGRYLGRFRHKTIVIWPMLFLVTLAVQQRLGMGTSLLSIGLTVLGVTWLTATIADRTSAERPVRVLVAVLWHELSAARPALRGTRSGRAAVPVRTVVPRKRPKQQEGPVPQERPAPVRTRRRVRDFA